MSYRSRYRVPASVVGILAVALTVTASPVMAVPERATPLSIFPSDALTVADGSQLTGRRVNLPLDGCGAPISCGLVARLNQLDGFDLDPRLALRFPEPVDPAKIARSLTLRESGGAWHTGVDRVVYDPETFTVYAHPEEQLAPGTEYTLRLAWGSARKAVEETFTTMSATDGLLDLQRQIDSGSAFAAAGIEDPSLQVQAVFPAAGTTVSWATDRGAVDPPPVPQPVPTAAIGGTIAFGSFRAPSWLTPDVTIPQTPTGDAGPAPVAAQTLPFVAVLPPGPAPDGGWPVAVFGHGFTNSTNTVLLAAVANAQHGIATIGTNVVGHGFGPESGWIVTSGGTTTTVPALGRGTDQDADGDIESSEGASATGAATAQSSRDALRQTAADNMTLIRSLAGTDVDGDGGADLSGKDVTYVGQSFGGIYGTMLTGADPAVARAALNVPGGPISEIARLSPAFRPLTSASLQAAGLLNSADPTRAFFQEQLPLRGEGPLTVTVAGAAAIQDYLAKVTWLTRPGSPETFAPAIAAERVLLQVAFGDQTVPNPTSYTLVDAGGLWARTSLYRNDRTANAPNNPHAFLLQLGIPAALQGQAQVAAFLRTGTVVDPDGPGGVWEVPISDPDLLLPLNYPQPALRP